MKIKNNRRSKDYVNNKTLYSEIVKWYESGKEEIPTPIVLGIMQICERLGTKSNFRPYSYIDEMISSGMESCINAIKNKKFDPERTDNPFAYFTQIAWNDFIKIIQEEKKQSYIKHKSLEQHYTNSMLNGEMTEDILDHTGRSDDLVEKFEKKKKNE